MEKTARALVKLLEAQDPSLRVAAMRVVAALEMRQKAVIDGLAANLDHESEALQIQALRTMAQLGSTEAVALVAPKILEGGAIRQHASQVLAMSGSSAVPVLRRLYAKADYHGRRVIVSTLADIGGRPVFQFLLKSLQGEDLEMIKNITHGLRGVLTKLGKASKMTALRDLRAFMKLKTTQRNPHAVISSLILLGGFSDKKIVAEAQKLLFPYLHRKQPEPVRRNAAISLSRLPIDPKNSDALAIQIIPLLCDNDWQPVPQNLLPILQRLQLKPATLNKLLPLLQKSSHGSVRIHVLSRLHGQDRATVVKAVLPHLSATHPRLREGAEAALKTMPVAIDALFDRMMDADNTDVCRRISGILKSYPEKTRKKYAPKATDRMLKLFEKDDDGYVPLLDFVCDSDVVVLQKRIATRVRSLKKSSSRTRFEKISGLLKLLADRRLLTVEQRYEYALILLRQSKKDVRRELRTADPSLHTLSNLARQDGAKLIRNLTKEKTLGADDYYYIGFHWSEGAELQEHGQKLLQHVVSKYPRHKLKKAAKQKIDLLG